MHKMIQIRNVPEPLHRTMKARAALAGMSLSDYLLAELQRLAERPSRQELVERLKSRESVVVSEPPVVALAAEREAR